MTTATTSGPREAYLPWAPHYDEFTEHPAYPGWVRRLEALAGRERRPGDRALDIGCGTGKSSEPLIELGYQVTGCDQSPEMLAVARRKLGAQARFVEATLPKLPNLGSFQYVSCVNDVVNYLLDEEELTASLRAIARNLARDGVLVFDTSTDALYRSYWADGGLRWTEGGEAAVLWHGETPRDFEPGGLGLAIVEVFTPDGDRWQRATCRHVQRHHTEDVVAAAVQDAGLVLEAVYGQYDDGHPEQPLRPDHTKAVHVVTHA